MMLTVNGSAYRRKTSSSITLAASALGRTDEMLSNPSPSTCMNHIRRPLRTEGWGAGTPASPSASPKKRKGSMCQRRSASSAPVLMAHGSSAMPPHGPVTTGWQASAGSVRARVVTPIRLEGLVLRGPWCTAFGCGSAS
jgi:hypothetical protein